MCFINNAEGEKKKQRCAKFEEVTGQFELNYM